MISLGLLHCDETGGRVDGKTCWGSYWKYQDVTHAICCAHLLRELNGVIENHPEQTWAVRFKKLLLDMKKVRDKALLSDKDEVSQYRHKFDLQTG